MWMVKSPHVEDVRERELWMNPRNIFDIKHVIDAE